MENLSGLKLLHYQVKNNIFEILIKYNFISHLSSTLYSRVPVYSFSSKFPDKISSDENKFSGSLYRLLEINFLLSVSGETEDEFFFIKNEDYNKLNDIEKGHHALISQNILMDKIFIRKSLSFLDETL
jgi:hypothetical protein